MIKVTVDGFGGDNSPNCVLEGCLKAIEEKGDLSISITGNKEKLVNAANTLGIDINKFTILNSSGVIASNDDPTEIMKKHQDTSMAIGLSQLKKGTSDAFVSSGNTGALAIGASTIVGRIKGIKRAALSPIMPSKTGCFILLDAGANLICRSDMLCQFAIMGSIYMNKVLGIDNPKIGLANVGAEDSKGTDELKDANMLLRKITFLNFIGNIEARDIPLGKCDVAVADGLSGNMILKSMEGTCIFFIDQLKSMFLSSAKSKLSALLLKKQLKELKIKMDYAEYGGAILLGIKKPVIKAHGSSDANAIKNAIFQAKKCVDENIILEIENGLIKMNEAIKNE